MNHTTNIKSIVRLLSQVSGRHDRYTVFSDCMELMALSVSNAVDKAQFQGREARYLQLVSKYNRADLDRFCGVLAEVTMAMEGQPDDILGAVFGAMELHNASRGQFFTPMHVCQLMARLQMANGRMQRIIDKCGYITVLEPACGAGAMVIAAALTMQELGYSYQRQLHVTATDIDARAAHMAYVQLSLLHIPAVVVVGNSLTCEVKEKWHTPAHILGGWHHRLAKDQDEQEQSSGSNRPESRPHPEQEQEPVNIPLPWQTTILPSGKAQLPLF